MSANGQLADSELTKIAESWIDDGKGIRLANITARAWNNMKAAALRDGIELWPAQPAGGYRSLATQRGMKVSPGNYGLNPASAVNIAAPGYSTHGDGRCVDIGSFPPASDPGRFGDAGRQRRTWIFDHAVEYGFSRTFGENDPNHFRHNGSSVGPAAPAGAEDIKEIIVATVSEFFGAKLGGSAGVDAEDKDDVEFWRATSRIYRRVTQTLSLLTELAPLIRKIANNPAPVTVKVTLDEAQIQKIASLVVAGTNYPTEGKITLS